MTARAILIAATLVSCAKREGQIGKASPGVPTVAVARVERITLSNAVSVAAEFRPYQEVDLHAKIAGYLREIHVDVGDRVKAGASLAVLEVPELNLELAQAAAAEKRTEIEVGRARSDLERAQSALKIRELSHERLASIVSKRPGLVAQQEIDDSQAKLEEARAQLSAAKATLASTEQQVLVSKAAAARVTGMKDYLRIVAPFSGTITRRYADPGAMIQQGTTSSSQARPVVRISQVDRLRLAVPVPESMAPRLKIGDPVEVRVDALDRTITGRLARVTGTIDSGTRTMEAQIDVENPKGDLRPGMIAQASIRVDRAPNALAVPVEAVKESKGRAMVWIVSPEGKAEERDVTRGVETADYVQLLSGAREGEMVVVGSNVPLQNGARVTPKPTKVSS